MIDHLVSTIIPVFNRPERIRTAFESVIAQTYRPIEIIVVDDGSSDSTPEVLKELVSENSELVRVYRQENAGAAFARNHGFNKSRGEFIQYLDSDDELAPRKFEAQVAALSNHPRTGVCYGVTRRRNTVTNAETDWAKTNTDIQNIFPSFLMQRGWDTNSPLWRRSTCEAIGPWGNFCVNEDWEHDLRAGMLGVVPCRVKEIVAIVNDHPAERASGMSSGFTPKIVNGMFESHQSIWEKMKANNLTDWSYLEEFSRKVFWIARLCGEHGLVPQANQTLESAQEMVSMHGSPWKLKAFGAATKVCGWRNIVRSSEFVRSTIQAWRGAK